jgi:6-phosphogluconolactonase
MRTFSFLAALVLAVPALAADPAYNMYVGTYTGHGSEGIYAWRFDPSTGKSEPLGLAAKTENPTFLAIDPSGKYLYAANEVGTGRISAFSVDPKTGKLTALNTSGSGGSGPCHLSIDKSARAIVTANYGSGTVALVRVNGDGSLGAVGSEDQHKGTGGDKARQEGPHAHSINFTPDGHFAVAADLGTDQLYVYRFDAAKGELIRDDRLGVKTAPAAGPRHFAFHPNGKYGYAINELNSTVTVYSYDGAGGLRAIESLSTLPKGFHGENSTAEVVVHPNGRTLYASNRGHDSIAVFSINPATGKLTFVEHVPTQGKTPRNFALDPTGKYLFAANQTTNNIALFRVGADGRLTFTGQTLNAVAPVCIRFVAAAK